MKIDFIKSNEKRRIIDSLNEQFGISNLPYLLIQTGKEKIRAFSGHLSKEEIYDIGNLARIEFIGLYIIKKEEDYRLSIDATNLLKEQINKNIIELNEENFQKWIRGHDLDIQAQKGTVVIKYLSDFIGCGKSNGKKIFNYIPKERRLKKN